MRFACRSIRLLGALVLGLGAPVLCLGVTPQASAAPGDVRVEKDVAYLGPERAEKGDLYLPPASDAAARYPGIVIIHGGGWSGGDKGASREQNIGTTLAQNGYVCISINYLLQPRSGPPIWPQNLHDCKVAVQWLRANADRLQIDPENIGVIGGSAGGHLAAMVGVTGPESGLDPSEPYPNISCRVQAVIDMYGPMARVDHRVRRLIGKSCEEAPELCRQITPLSHLDPADPPVLILHGTADTTVAVSDSEDFAAALQEAGVEHQLIIIPDAPHTFHLQPKQRDLRPVVLEFLNKHLKGQGN
ncbi:alpha/beta hydrolase [Candidatus Laterigemmans baculatus]|uniref:alpha/beta hydrolase n=1 Tax=Candidatus Laterigemmans baculatus TaxID=2770505 RepID=UPI0013D8F9B5|nr:alpha/beta hydrolase [Candidatus Laterigemmans baculatus]